MNPVDILITLIFIGAAGISVESALSPLLRTAKAVFPGRDPLIHIPERKLERTLPDVLDMVVSGMTAGYSLQQALEAAVESSHHPFAQVLNPVLARVRSGHALDEALEWAAEKFSGRSIPLALYTMASSHRRGTNLIESLTLIAKTARERETLRRKVYAMTAQGRLQGLVLCIVPLLFILGLFAVAPTALVPVVRSSPGRSLLLVSLLLQSTGAIVVHRMVRREFL
jgi:tight adherence protein B